MISRLSGGATPSRTYSSGPDPLLSILPCLSPSLFLHLSVFVWLCFHSVSLFRYLPSGSSCDHLSIPRLLSSNPLFGRWERRLALQLRVSSLISKVEMLHLKATECLTCENRNLFPQLCCQIILVSVRKRCARKRKHVRHNNNLQLCVSL